MIWLIACLSPIFFPRQAQVTTINAFAEAISKHDSSLVPPWERMLTRPAAIFFLSVCAWSFVFANIWGLSRKSRLVDALLTYLTGRDWYPSISFRFLSQNIDRLIAIKSEEGSYMGILAGAPESKDDKYLILTHPAFMKNEQGAMPEPLTKVHSLLIKFDDFNQIQAVSGATIEPKRRRLRASIASFLVRSFAIACEGIKYGIEKGQQAIKELRDE